MTVTIRLDTKSLDDLLRQLEDDVNEAVRPAAQAAAQVLYDAVEANVAALGRKTGNLDKSIYQVYSKTKSNAEVASYEIGWNRRIAPHGQLIEFGYMQRYEMGKDESGRFTGPMIRPEMMGKPKPSSRAAQSVKDAYYIPRIGGPVQVPAKAFIRGAQSRFPQALEAAKNELLSRIK